MATQVKNTPMPSMTTEKPKSVVAMAQAMPGQQHDEVRMAAYLRWEAAGKPAGDGVNFWLDAEKALLER